MQADTNLAQAIIAASTWGKVMDGALADPRWDEAGRVHDWRNHVPAFLILRWPELGEVAQAAVYLVASKAADAEEWD